MLIKSRMGISADGFVSTPPPGRFPGAAHAAPGGPHLPGRLGRARLHAGMTDDGRLPPVARLAQPRRGHFDLGTGYHGDLWLDLDALFLRPARLRPYVQWVSARLDAHQIDAVCGPLEGGAFLALAVADVLDAAFVPAGRAPAPARPGTACLPAWNGGWPAGGSRSSTTPSTPGPP